MLAKIILSIVFIIGLVLFYLARKIADKFFAGKDKAMIALKIIGGVIALTCAILAVYI